MRMACVLCVGICNALRVVGQARRGAGVSGIAIRRGAAVAAELADALSRDRRPRGPTHTYIQYYT